MKLLPLPVAALALAGCAASAQPDRDNAPRAGRDCFSVASVSGYSSVSRDTIRLDVGPGRRYEVDISGPQCSQVEWTERIALEARPSSWICVGQTVGQGSIRFRDSATRQSISCQIDAVRRLEPGG